MKYKNFDEYWESIKDNAFTFNRKTLLKKTWDVAINSIPIEPPVKPEICVRISKINSGDGFIDSERLSKYFAEYNLIPQQGTKINLVSEDGQYLEQFDVIQVYYDVDKKLKIEIYLDEY